MSQPAESTQETGKEFLATQPLGPLMAKLALPAIASQLVALLYNIVDRAFIGHIPGAGVDALTGLGLVAPLIVIIQSFGIFIGAGASPLAGMRLGAGDAKGAKQVMGTAAVMLAIVSVAVLLVFYPCGGPMLAVFGASANTLPYAQTYLYFYLPGVPFMIAGHVSSMFLLAQGNSREVFVANTAASVINVALDALFIFGFGWGVAGAGAATAIAEVACAVIVVRYLQKPTSAFRIERAYLTLQGAVVRRTLSNGAGKFFISITEGILIVVLNAQIQAYGGDVYVAALTVLETVLTVSFSIASGFAQGTQGILSYCYGAQMEARVRRAMKLTILVSAIIEGATTLAVIIFAQPIAQIFTSDAAALTLAVAAMPLFLAGNIPFGIQLGIQGIFIGTGHGLCSLVVAFVRKIVVFIPLAFILPPIFGAWGVIMAEPISDLISIVFCSVFFAVQYRRILRDMRK